MNKIASIIIATALILGLGIIFFAGSEKTTRQLQNVSVVDGIQYVTIKAKGGYSPQTSNATSGIPTKLIIETNGTYDCSLALVIKSIGYQKILPQTGKETIDLGIVQKGKLLGVCSMGMYSFAINFE